MIAHWQPQPHKIKIVDLGLRAGGFELTLACLGFRV